MTGVRSPEKSPHYHVARFVLAVFLGTFLVTRIFVLLIMMRFIPDFYLYLGGTHVHHFNYGVFLLVGVGAYFLFRPTHGAPPRAAIFAYAVGIALTFDEFGMWFHLGGSYWQRASFDAVAITAAGIALIAYAPSISRFRCRHWFVVVIFIIGGIVFGWLIIKSLNRSTRVLEPRIRQIEENAPL